jgi:phosphoribosylformylglycinamidine synthase subunit PurL
VGAPGAAEAVADAAWCFGESASRVVLSVAPELTADLLGRAARRGVPAAVLGEAGGTSLRVDGPAGPVLEVALDDAARAWRGAIPAALGLGASGSAAPGGAPTR